MGQKKLVRFAELTTFPNVLQYPEGMAGKWADFFGNTGPITLELACGKGEYTVGLAQLYPDRNFLGGRPKGKPHLGGRTQVHSAGVEERGLFAQPDRSDRHLLCAGRSV